jgi:hypothetical protein
MVIFLVAAKSNVSKGFLEPFDEAMRGSEAASGKCYKWSRD